MSWSDYDPPSLFSEKQVKALKPHKCYECHRPIKQHETYFKAKGLWDGEWCEFKTCSECQELKEHLLDKIYDDGFAFGDLGEAAREAGYSFEYYKATPQTGKERG